MNEMQTHDALLKMSAIRKNFYGVHALKSVDFELRRGEVHVLLGENGAGKSTLMKVLCGAYIPDSGLIELDGEVVRFKNPHDAQQQGISMIYQELMLAENLKVYQNIMLGRETLRNRLLRTIDDAEMRRIAESVLNGTLQAKIDVDASTSDLSVAQKQLVEIAKAILWDAKIIIMDEPTSSLTGKDVEILFGIIDQLRKNGAAVVYISHKMDEITRIANRVTIMRDGEYVTTLNMRDTNIEELIRLMVGRSLDDKYPREFVPSGETAIKVDGISWNNQLHDISFEARRGEIVGIFGLIGSGRTELAKIIFGAERADTGTMELFGRAYSPKNPGEAIGKGVGLVPEDRKIEGLVGLLSVVNNLTLPIIRRLSVFGLTNKRKQAAIARDYVGKLSIKTPDVGKAVMNLSGGNQQKVVIAKCLAAHSQIIIFDEPTRGVDIGAKVEIYKIMNLLLKQNVCIIMISSEMPELLALSDRIIVIRRGRISKRLDHAQATQEEILKWAL